MAQKVLITGTTGFAGSHLAEQLVSQKKYDIIGTFVSDASLKNISSVQKELKFVKVDLTNPEAVLDLIKTSAPDFVYHLAAFPSPAESYKNPSSFMQNNINAEINILEALRIHDMLSTRTLIVSSAEIYGVVAPEDLPVDEDTPLKPVSPYGVSKIAQDYLGLQYVLAFKMDVVRVRPFGHLGPRLSDQFVASAFSKKIAEIEKNKQEPILHVGNLEAKRDLTDVRDMVKAYELIMGKGETGQVYNIGSGVSYQIKMILDTLLSFTDRKIEVRVDEALLRPNDTPELVCDNKKITTLTGWKPHVPIEQSLKDTLDYWRGIV